MMMMMTLECSFLLAKKNRKKVFCAYTSKSNVPVCQCGCIVTSGDRSMHYSSLCWWTCTEGLGDVWTLLGVVLYILLCDFRWNRSSASDSAYSYTFHRSVVCLPSVCHLLHSCTLLKLFDGSFVWHLAGTLTVLDGIPDHQEMRRFGGWTINCKLLLPAGE